MNIVQAVARNTGISIAGTVVARFLGLGLAFVLSRYLGVAQYGLYSFLFAFLGFFSLLADLGIYQIVVREIGHGSNSASRLTGNAVTLRLALGVVAAGLVVPVGYVLGYRDTTLIPLAVAALALPISASTVYGAVLHARLRLEYATAIATGQSLLGVTLVVGAVWLHWGLVGIVAAASIVPGIVGGVSLALVARRFLKPSYVLDVKLWGWLVAESWPLAISSVFVTIYHRIDQVMLFQMLGAGAVGLYAVAVRLTEAMSFVANAFMSSVFPVLAARFGTDGNSFARATQLSFKYLSIVVLPAAATVMLLRHELIIALFGRQYMGASTSLAVLVWSEVWVFLGVGYSQVLIAAGQQRILLICTGVAAAANVVLNLALIPGLGIVGSSIATTIGYGIAQAMLLAFPQTRRYGVQAFAALLRPIIGLFAMLILYTLTAPSLGSVCGTAFGLAFYVVALVISRTLDRGDWMLFCNVLRRRVVPSTVTHP